MIAVVDGDSIAAAAGSCQYPHHMMEAVDNKIRQIYNDTQCSEMHGFVEDWRVKHNFRKYVAITRPYKGNRKKYDKPALMTEAKQYLVSQYGFRVCGRMESEDAMCIKATEIGLDKCYKCAIDKDVYCTPGVFYNYNTREWKTVTEAEAQLNLYKQIITGDNGDGIPGIPGAGPAAAKVLDGAAVEDLPMLCGYEYKKRGLHYENFVQQARLIYILRQRHEEPFLPLTLEQWEAIDVEDTRINDVIEILKSLDKDSVMEVFSKFCRLCGDNNPNCYCGRDE
jgi:hypothetical protein